MPTRVSLPPSILFLWLALLSVGAAVLNAGDPVQTTGPKPPSIVIRSLYGPDLFGAYCAPCHGRDGKGHGPVAHALKGVPPDLTTLAGRNGGAFPRQRVTTLLNGEGDLEASAHGSRAMPVWGPLFGGLDTDVATNKVRLANIVDYVDSIQVPVR